MDQKLTFMKARIFILFLFISTFLSATNGNFQIIGSKIIDPEGNEFIPKGVNVQGMKWVWPGNVVPQADVLINAWKFNIIRVNCRMYDSFWNGQNVSVNAHYQTVESMQAIVDAFTPHKVVVMFEFHDRTGSYYSGNDLEDLKDAFRDMCDLWKDNPYVWFNIMNEPGGSSANLNQWVSMHRDVIRVIRNEKQANNVVVVDAHYWGQDVGTWDANPVNEANSSILSRGNDLINFDDKTYENIMFSFHIYDQWNRGTAEQMEYKLHNYISRIKNKGLAVMIGEFGTNASDGSLYFPGAFRATMNVAPAHGVGLIWWHWYGGDALKLTTSGNGNGGNINSTTNPTNLTWPGQMIWDYTHHQGNVSPFVNIYNPLSSQVVSEGNALTVKVAAADFDDGIKEVRLYNQDQLVQILNDDPFDFVLPDIEAGRYVFKAVAVDSANTESTSTPIGINVSKSPHQGIILFITGNANLTQGDNALFDAVLKTGYRIIHRTQSEVQAIEGENRAAIIISSSVGSTSVGTMFANSKVPVLVASPYLFPSMKMTGSAQGTDYGFVNNQSQVRVLSTDHIITEGFSQQIEIYESPAKIGFGKPASGAEILLTANDDQGKATLFIFPKNSALSSMAAPAARAGWYAIVENGVILTETSLELFINTLKWLITNDELPTNIQQIKGNEKGSIKLFQNFPNPVHNHTTISYFIANSGVVTIKIVDLLGRVKDIVVDEFHQPGYYSIEFSLTDAYTSGIYYCRIESNNEFKAKPMLVH
jgi:mannan endo-1,4-beta-mannosidase